MSGKMLIPFCAALCFGLCACSTVQSDAKNEPAAEQKFEPKTIQDVHDFLKKNKVYYLATIDGDQARVRPFGTVMIYEGKLYIQTGRKKNVSKQIAKNGNVEICAFDGKCWLRLTGTLADDNRRAAKAAMLEQYPGLGRMYSPDDPNTQVLYFKKATAVFNFFGRPAITVKF